LQREFLEDLHEVLHHSLILGDKAAPKTATERITATTLGFIDLSWAKLSH
jgi:hypothetical protein